MEFPLPTTGSGASNPSDYESYAYDGNGNLTTKRLRSGDTVTLTYDALNRLTEESFASGASQPVFWAYDLLNRTLSVTTQSPTGPGVTYAYDALGRATSATQGSQTLSYAYDAAGNRTVLTFPDPAPNALTANYTYDALNHAVNIEQNGATSGPGLLATYGYDGLGRRTGIARAGGSGLATTYAYDAISRLSSLQQALAGAAGTTFGVTYNAANQVVTRTDSSGAYTIAPAAAASTYGVNGLNQYTTISGVEPVGSGPAMAMTYDPLGRLSSLTRGGITTDLLYDGAFLAGAYNPDGAISARYVPGPGTDEPLTVYTGPGTSSVAWYVPDQEGSIIATADQNANATGQFAYDPYGAPLNSAGAVTWSSPRYGYTGQIALNDAQTYFYKARMYDPTDGRFFQTDPAGFQGGINLYAYAMNDPVNAWDPTGMGGNAPNEGPGPTPACQNNNNCTPVSGITVTGIRSVTQYLLTGANAIISAALTSLGNEIGGSAGPTSSNKKPSNSVCKAVANLPAGYGIYINGQVTSVPGAGFSYSIQTNVVSDGQGGANYTTAEQDYAGPGLSIFAGATVGAIVPQFNSAAASGPLSAKELSPGSVKGAVGFGLDVGPSNLGLSFGFGASLGIFPPANPDNSATHTISSGHC